MIHPAAPTPRPFINTTATPNNLAWDSTLWQTAVVTPRRDHWLIQQIEDPSSQRQPERYLQIATGQWFAASRATKFPSRSSAVAYAKEYGLTLGQTARLVRPQEQLAA